MTANLPNLREIDNNDSYRRWHAGVIADSDWPVHLLVTCTYTEEYDREWAKGGKYHVDIAAVAPDAPDAETVLRCQQCHGVPADVWAEYGEEVKAVLLTEYGCKAVLWQSQGNNLRALLRDARRELLPIRTLFGFYMDRNQNACGNDGWDFIKGDIGFKNNRG